MTVLSIPLVRENTPPDRRRARRVRVDAQGQLYICPASSRTAPLDVLVRDVSQTGVGVVYEAPLNLGQKYIVKQPAVAQQTGGSVLFTVVRSERVNDREFNTGLHASHLLENDYVHSAHCPPQLETGRMSPVLIGILLLGMLAAMFLL